MPPKHYLSETMAMANLEGAKKKRRVITMEDKLKVINEYENGKAVNAIARQLGWSHSTITTILNNRTKIVKAVKEDTPMTSTIITKQREALVSDVEKLLLIWIDEEHQKYVTLTQTMVTSKARALFRMLKTNAGPCYNVQFNATTKWFKRFKKRNSLQNIIVSDDAVGTGVLPAQGFPEQFDNLMGMEGYYPQQMFNNMNESLLGWRDEPRRPFAQNKDMSNVQNQQLHQQPDGQQHHQQQQQQQQPQQQQQHPTGVAPPLPPRVLEEPPKRKFTEQGLADMFSTFHSALKQAEEMDPDAERVLLVKSKIYDAIACYKDSRIFEEEEPKDAHKTLQEIIRKKAPSLIDPKQEPVEIVTVVLDKDSKCTVKLLPIDHMLVDEPSN